MQQEYPTREVKLPTGVPAKLISWSVSVGDTIRKGSVLCKYQLAEGAGKAISLKSPCVGVIKQLLVQETATLQPGYIIFHALYKLASD